MSDRKEVTQMMLKKARSYRETDAGWFHLLHDGQPIRASLVEEFLLPLIHAFSDGLDEESIKLLKEHLVGWSVLEAQRFGNHTEFNREIGDEIIVSFINTACAQRPPLKRDALFEKAS